jgi:hypothetical protein
MTSPTRQGSAPAVSLRSDYPSDVEEATADIDGMLAQLAGESEG